MSKSNIHISAKMKTYMIRLFGTIAVFIVINIIFMESKEVVRKLDFEIEKGKLIVGDTISFLNKSNLNNSNWNWDFGDGESSIKKSPTHVFKKPGEKTIVLKVDTLVKKIKIRIKPIKLDYLVHVSNTSILEGEKLTLRDSTLLPWPNKWRFTWDLGNGYRSNRRNIKYQYPRNGSYNISLFFKDVYGNEGEYNTSVLVSAITNPVPSINLALDVVDSAFIGDNVEFTSITTPSIDISEWEWEWEFGDRKSSNRQNPIHKFKKLGHYSYSVTLTNKLSTSVRPIVKRGRIKINYKANYENEDSLAKALTYIANEQENNIKKAEVIQKIKNDCISESIMVNKSIELHVYLNNLMISASSDKIKKIIIERGQIAKNDFNQITSFNAKTSVPN